MKRTLFALMLIANFLSLNAAQKESTALKKELKEAQIKGEQAYRACLAECVQKGLGARGWPKDINEVPVYMQESWIGSEVNAEHECLHGSPGLMGRRFLEGECGKVRSNSEHVCALIEKELREAWLRETQGK